MNGYETEIFEMHNLPGGLCTAWQRRDYIFDGCLISLRLGPRPAIPSLSGRSSAPCRTAGSINHAEFVRVQGDGGRELIVWADPDRLEAHMTELSPADAGRIHAFCQGIRVFARFDMSVLQQKPRDLMGPLDWARLGVKMLPFAPTTARYSIVSAKEFAAGFHDPFLRRAVPFMFAWPDMPVMAGLSLLAYMHTGNAGFPAGGSLALARAVEQRYLELGGESTTTPRWRRSWWKTTGPWACGCITTRCTAPTSSSRPPTGRATIFDMLDGKYVNGGVAEAIRRAPAALPTAQVSFGVNRDLAGEPQWTVHLLNEPVLIAGQERAT